MLLDFRETNGLPVQGLQVEKQGVHIGQVGRGFLFIFPRCNSGVVDVGWSADSGVQAVQQWACRKPVLRVWVEERWGPSLTVCGRSVRKSLASPGTDETVECAVSTAFAFPAILLGGCCWTGGPPCPFCIPVCMWLKKPNKLQPKFACKGKIKRKFYRHLSKMRPK